MVREVGLLTSTLRRGVLRTKLKESIVTLLFKESYCRLQFYWRLLNIDFTVRSLSSPFPFLSMFVHYVGADPSVLYFDVTPDTTRVLFSFSFFSNTRLTNKRSLFGLYKVHSGLTPVFFSIGNVFSFCYELRERKVLFCFIFLFENDYIGSHPVFFSSFNIWYKNYENGHEEADRNR